MNKKITLLQGVSYLVLVSVLLTIVASTFFAYYIVVSSSEKELNSRVQTIQKFIVRDIESGILSGAHADVYTNCQSYIKDKNILILF